MVAKVAIPLRDDRLRQLPLEFEHVPSHAADDFLVGEGNALAHSRIGAWPHWPDAVTLDGRLSERHDSTLVLVVNAVTRGTGVEEVWSGDPVTLPLSAVRQLQTRRLDTRRSSIAAAVVLVGGVLLGQAFRGAGSDVGKSGPGSPGGRQ